MTGIVAGLVDDYLPARGRFDAWAADPDHGGRLDLAELDLVGKRNHILRTALTALPDTSRQLLSTLALLPEAVDYDTLSAFNPYLPPEPETVPEPVRPEDRTSWKRLHEEQRQAARVAYAREVERHAEYQRAHRAWWASPEVSAAPRNLSRTVTDLERRGLLQYDRQAGRYDLHPVVRGVAAGGLRAEDRERLGQQVLDHFSALPHNPYEGAESLDDLRNGLTVVRTLLRMGRTQQACDAYWGELSEALFFNLEAYAEVLSLLRPFFAHGWTSPSANLPDRDVAYLATDVATSLSRIDEQGQALAVYGVALEIDLKQKSWHDIRVDLTNLAKVLDEQNRLAQSERCLALALELAELINNPEDLFKARLVTFERFAQTGRMADAERIWQSLDPMGRNWSRAQYRPGDAELSHARFQLDRGTLTEEHLVRAERLARSGRNRNGVRSVHAVRGQWLLQQGEWTRAADSFAEAVRMAREAGIADPWSETWLALARLRLGQLPEPVQEAERLAGLRELAHLPLAELWQAIGHTKRATEHALAAYRYAWADGEPHVRRSQLERAAHLLNTLGAGIPALPAYDLTTDPKLPWEDKIAAVIETLRGEKKLEF